MFFARSLFLYNLLRLRGLITAKIQLHKIQWMREFIDGICLSKMRMLRHKISLSVWLIHLEFTIVFAKSLLIHFLLRDFTMNTLCFSRIYYLFRESTMNLLSASSNHYNFTICFANYLWIHSLLRDLSLNSLFFTNSPWIHFSSATSRRIHYLFRDFTLIILFFRVINMN